MRNSLRIGIACFLLATASAGGASASDYWFRIGGGWSGTTPGNTVPPEVEGDEDETAMSLADAVLPEAIVGETWSYDFSDLLVVKGMDETDVAWTIEGHPAWLSMSSESGISTGLATAPGDVPFDVVARKEGVEARRTYVLHVAGTKLEAVQVAAGLFHTCAVTLYGSARCWGYGREGELGTGYESGYKSAPVQVHGLTSGIASISTGYRHTCATTNTGGARCWGYNQTIDAPTFVGQLGTGTDPLYSQFAYEWAQVVGLESGVASVSAGRHHTCAAMTDGTGRCWGQADLLGSANFGTTNTGLPVSFQIPGSRIASVSAGGASTCAVTTEGAAWCWGSDEQGQLGDGGGYVSSRIPVMVSGLSSGVASVSVGASHACASMIAGGARCWGSDGSGQLGDGGGSVASTAPRQVVGLSGRIAAISAGGEHTCAAMEDGTASCWGSDTFGVYVVYGENPRVSQVAVAVAGLPGPVASVSVGAAHACALGRDRSVRCWGLDNYGQDGNGWANSLPGVPVQVVREWINGVHQL